MSANYVLSQKGKLPEYGAKNKEFLAYGGCIKCFLCVINTRRWTITPLVVIDDEQMKTTAMGGMEMAMKFTINVVVIC